MVLSETKSLSASPIGKALRHEFQKLLARLLMSNRLSSVSFNTNSGWWFQFSCALFQSRPNPQRPWRRQQWSQYKIQPRGSWWKTDILWTSKATKAASAESIEKDSTCHYFSFSVEQPQASGRWIVLAIVCCNDRIFHHLPTNAIKNVINALHGTFTANVQYVPMVLDFPASWKIINIAISSVAYRFSWFNIGNRLWGLPDTCQPTNWFWRWYQHFFSSFAFPIWSKVRVHHKYSIAHFLSYSFSWVAHGRVMAASQLCFRERWRFAQPERIRFNDRESAFSDKISQSIHL